MNGADLLVFNKLQFLIEDVCPIYGIAGNIVSSENIRIDFKPEATKEQKTKAIEIKNKFNYNSILQQVISDELKKKKNIDNLPQLEKAVIMTSLDIINSILAKVNLPNITFAQYKTMVEDKYDTLGA